MKKLKNKYECIIVNADNNSEDGTNKIFQKVNTYCKKISLIDDRIGKGINVINFLKYCQKNEVDYAILIDSDLKSFKSKWIYKMIKQLEKRKSICITII